MRLSGADGGNRGSTANNRHASWCANTLMAETAISYAKMRSCMAETRHHSLLITKCMAIKTNIGRKLAIRAH